MKITKQKVQSVADLKAGYTLGHADVAMLKAMARQLLSGLEQEPVATFYKSECGNVFNTLDSWLPVDGVNKLYAAPQLPQQAVVPEYLENLRSLVADKRALPRRKEWVSGQQYSYVLLENVEGLVEEACRAAMLQGKGE